MPRTDLWTREEMILALNLYLKLPFGKMDRRNPQVKQLAILTELWYFICLFLDFPGLINKDSFLVFYMDYLVY